MWSLYKRHNTLYNKTRPDLSLNCKNTQSEFEALWLEIISPNKDNILVGVTYRHPKQKDKGFLQFLSNTLKKVKKENKKIILTGDFNLNLLNLTKTKKLMNFLIFSLQSGLLRIF